MSHWLFDLGNSRFKGAPLLADGRVGEVTAWPHGGEAFAAGDIARLPSGDVAWLASVASPELRERVLQALSGRFRQVVVARTQARCAGVQIAYAQPERFGVDRFLALLGACEPGVPALVAGVGTALTIDLLDGEGRHRGGRIAASPTTMREALHQRAVQLPAEGGTYREFADDTDDALASGCDGAAVALIERSLREAARLLGREPALLLHGGGAEALLPWLPTASERPRLVLEGLAAWARENASATG